MTTIAVIAMARAAWLVLALLLAGSALASALHPPALPTTVDEAGIMRGLRRLLHPTAGTTPVGQRTSAGAHHCSWDRRSSPRLRVVCNAARMITELHIIPPVVTDVRPAPVGSSGSAVPQAIPVPLEVAQLARLPALEALYFGSFQDASWQEPLPQAWLHPESFPSLSSLELRLTHQAGAPLPDIPPGALPALQNLTLALPVLRSPLPASWGASPHVLPALRQLSLTLQVDGGLPLAWGPGFQQLHTLVVVSMVQPQLAAGSTAAPPPLHQLWVIQLQQCQLLKLTNLGLRGSLSDVLQAPGSFPSVRELDLSGNSLTGTLPPHLFSSLPYLNSVALDNNELEGMLPPEWASSKVFALSVATNRLAGPAFPPAWLRGPAAMPNLHSLQLSHNPGLTGTLPPNLPRNLRILSLAGTGVTGTVPAAWCGAGALRYLLIEETAINSRPPPCLLSNHSNLYIQSSGAVVAPGIAAPAPPGPAAPAKWPAVAAGLAAALVLCVLAVAGLAGRVLPRPRRVAAEQLGMLHEEAQRGLLQAEAGSTSSSSAASHAGLVRQVHRRRLSSLLSATLGTNRHGIHLISFEEMQAGLAHQLEQQETATDRAAAVAALASREGEGSAGGIPACCLTAGPLPQRSRQWGLPTQSLRVPASALQFLLNHEYELMEVGSGGHALVVLAMLQPGAKTVAAKVFELEAGVDSSTMWREVAMLRQCRHPRLVPLLGVTVQGPLLVLALELMPRGSLHAALKDPGTSADLRWDVCGRQVAVDVAEALDHLHTQLGVMHGDLKPGNVLLSSDWRACLGDLGLAQLLGTGARTAAGYTRAYAAPEQLMGQRCTLGADMYSFGLLLVALLTQKVTAARGGWRLPRVPEECPQEVLCLIQECLLAAPQQRPTAAQALARLAATSASLPATPCVSL